MGRRGESRIARPAEPHGAEGTPTAEWERCNKPSPQLAVPRARRSKGCREGFGASSGVAAAAPQALAGPRRRASLTHPVWPALFIRFTDRGQHPRSGVLEAGQSNAHPEEMVLPELRGPGLVFWTAGGEGILWTSP